jgi:hypothetical protein
MSFWNFLGRMAISDKGETIQRISDTTSVSSDGTTYTTMGNNTYGSDGSVFTQTGSFSSDGSTRMGSTATGLGAVFNKRGDGWPGQKSLSTLKASTIQFGVTNILTNSAPLSSRDVKLRYEECLQNWGNATNKR